MKVTVCLYDNATGLFKSRWSGSSSQLAANIPEGQSAIEGDFDLYSKRVNIETGEVEDYQPPAPDESHYWDQETRRWRLPDEVLSARLIDAATRDEIRRIESGDLRTMREALLSLLPPGSEHARRLSDSESRISELRPAVIPQGR
jgi:hypothetical protein